MPQTLTTAHIIKDRDNGEELCVEVDITIARSKLIQYLNLGISAYMVTERNFLCGKFRT